MEHNTNIILKPSKRIKNLRQRIGTINHKQIVIWQQMSPIQRLEIAFQAYQFAIEAVRVTERQRHPNLSKEEFNWRVTRRMQRNQKLGKEINLEQHNSSRIK